METMKVTLIFALALCLAIFVPCFEAEAVDEASSHILDFDDYWRNRSMAAAEAAKEAYHHFPEKVTKSFNRHVDKAIKHLNGTRRNLKQNKGPCEATNPIDRCWRCKQDWAQNRKQLATCVLGFGRKTRGGMDGPYYIVTDASDDDVVNPKPGTLRHAVIQKGPLWIYFARSMIIRLKEELIMTSDKTIDGRGVDVHIAYGAGLMIQFARNVIVHGLYIHDIIPKNGGLIRDAADHFGYRTKSDGDGISIYGSTDIWIDHISMRHCEDGMIDAVAQSTAITISNCHFTHHKNVILLGASDTDSRDRIMQVTLAFNHFGKGLVHRMPRCRWGFFHVVNNDYTHWLMYAIGGSSGPTIISQGNRFIAPPDPNCKQVTNRYNTAASEWKSWIWKSEKDLFINGAFFVESGDKFQKKYSRLDMIKAKPGTAVRRLTRNAGALKCREGRKC